MSTFVIICSRCKEYLYDSEKNVTDYCTGCNEVFNKSKELAAQRRDEGKRDRDEIWDKYVENPTRR